MAQSASAGAAPRVFGKIERLVGPVAANRVTRFRFGIAARLAFYEDMESFVREKIPPSRAIEKMHVVMRPHRSQRVLTTVLGAVAVQMATGASLARALSSWIPSEEAALLQAGEQTGDLGVALARLRELVSRKLAVREALRAELMPAGLMVVALAIIMRILQSTLLDAAVDMVPPQYLARTAVAGPYIAFAAFVQSWGLLLVATAIGVTGLIYWSLDNWRPSRTRQFLDERVIPWSMYRRQSSTFFLVSAAAMMRAGTPFQRAVAELQATATPWSRTHMQRMLARLRSGVNPVAAMGTGLLPWEIQARLEIYAELPNTPDVMESTARASMIQLLKRAKTTGTIVRTAVMLAFAAFILATLFSQQEITLALEAAAKSGAL